MNDLGEHSIAHGLVSGVSARAQHETNTVGKNKVYHAAELDTLVERDRETKEQGGARLGIRKLAIKRLTVSMDEDVTDKQVAGTSVGYTSQRDSLQEDRSMPVLRNARLLILNRALQGICRSLRVGPEETGREGVWHGCENNCSIPYHFYGVHKSRVTQR